MKFSLRKLYRYVIAALYRAAHSVTCYSVHQATTDQQYWKIWHYSTCTIRINVSKYIPYCLQGFYCYCTVEPYESNPEPGSLSNQKSSPWATIQCIIFISSFHYKMTLYTIRKEMKCSWDSEILHSTVHEKVRDTTRITLVLAFPIFVLYHELFRVVSRNPCYTLFPC